MWEIEGTISFSSKGDTVSPYSERKTMENPYQDLAPAIRRPVIRRPDAAREAAQRAALAEHEQKVAKAKAENDAARAARRAELVAEGEQAAIDLPGLEAAKEAASKALKAAIAIGDGTATIVPGRELKAARNALGSARAAIEAGRIARAEIEAAARSAS